nr:rac guanine nucleotide exchange factor B-like [Ciona intestinalis]|eukprot:XP_018667130.2 rac guanine nucleotide exchange factor B-like [Ciona intestinalis]
MANRPKGYGYSREVASKIDAKYSEEDEMEVVAWVSSLVQSSPEQAGKEGFHAWLQDGQVLCQLMNVLQAGICKPNPTYTGSMQAMKRNKEMENIGMFLSAAAKYGVKSEDQFQTVDLYEGGNLGQVQATLYKLSSVAMKNGMGEGIGVKIADENKRNFDEQKTREGRNIIGLQMGTNQVASQRGMTAYGLGRQLTPQKLNQPTSTMANRPKGYGYSREVASKIDAKYSEEDELEVVAWISSFVQSSPDEEGKEAFHAWLKDGQVLCQLMNVLQNGSCKPNQPYTGTMQAMKRNKEMENIGMFLSAAAKYGVKSEDQFQTVDLYEGGNLGQVQATLYKLSSVAMKNGMGEGIGVKIADENKRNFDEQKTREGRNVIGLQMGTNQVASQGGMTPYGLGRQLTGPNLNSTK